jgi:hypothetical protein
VEDIFEEKLGLYTCSKFYKINFWKGLFSILYSP